MNRQNYAVILAAGFSQRMGSDKAALPWLGGSLLSYQVSQWLALGVTPVVVLGSHNSALQQQCPGDCVCVVNPLPEAGKAGTLLRGLAAVGDWDGGFCAIAAVDQPRPAAVYQRLIAAYERDLALITAPTHQGRLGHPLLFAAAMRPQLMAIREETLGLRQVIQNWDHAIHRCPCPEPIVLADLNTPERYQTWFAQASGW
ncbi:nucleotidyltransferase family protein [Romeria aff. gracilis LEGE 07310]|uniref:Nucleotidyltransferase family protein n=1 Tax=Vasconcelosia minhoensis LEGE 07310 TaxID=915328 RepID=A0A8J7ANV3_9CYAN|nr:nucleotidyltransferase family protein [Romeria gracilis]MBE9077889.1 nucleotidyltransferase family protein [Romeria aff. gracilis LEGE 07310]